MAAQLHDTQPETMAEVKGSISQYFIVSPPSSDQPSATAEITIQVLAPEATAASKIHLPIGWYMRVLLKVETIAHLLRLLHEIKLTGFISGIAE